MGKKVMLRPVIEDDIPQFQEWINDPLNSLTLAVTWPVHEQGQREWFDKVTKMDRDNLTLAVCTHDGTLIGNMAIHFDRAKQSAVTGSLIGSHEHKGQGYGTDAKMLLLDYAFNWVGVRKVHSPIIDFNARSRGYAKACGYKHVATIPGEYYRDGAWRDEVLYIVWREKWLPLWEQYRKGLPHYEEQKELLAKLSGE